MITVLPNRANSMPSLIKSFLTKQLTEVANVNAMPSMNYHVFGQAVDAGTPDTEAESFSGQVIQALAGYTDSAGTPVPFVLKGYGVEADSAGTSRLIVWIKVDGYINPNKTSRTKHADSVDSSETPKSNGKKAKQALQDLITA